ncbi:MAG: hypothetical protein V4805_11690, partial [Pseudomonadota bacterium]
MSHVKKLSPLLTTHTIPSVPLRYRGVWRRTLLEAADVYDVATNVLWMQTSRWHADLRIPALRPDFSQVDSLAACNHEQLMWLAQQQGFAGVTEVDFASQAEICRWHRLVDFRPPAATPDAGCMTFEPTQLVETGVHAEYLEHWIRLSDTESGFAVFKYDSDTSRPPRLLLIAGDAVMHVRARPTDWPAELPPDFDMMQLDDTALRMMLD